MKFKPSLWSDDEIYWVLSDDPGHYGSLDYRRTARIMMWLMCQSHLKHFTTCNMATLYKKLGLCISIISSCHLHSNVMLLKLRESFNFSESVLKSYWIQIKTALSTFQSYSKWKRLSVDLPLVITFSNWNSRTLRTWNFYCFSLAHCQWGSHTDSPLPTHHPLH